MKETLQEDITTIIVEQQTASNMHIRAGVVLYTGVNIGAMLLLETSDGYVAQQDGTSHISIDGMFLVTFSSALPSSSYVLSINCYNTSNESVGYVISSRTSSSFTILPLEASTIEYTAIYTQ